MKKIIVPVLLGFGVVLAVIIGQRMSTDAMAVVIGVAVGVAASVPTSLLLVALLRRQRQPLDDYRAPEYNTRQLQQPPVIVVNPGQWMGQGQQPMPMPPAQMMDGGQRQISVVGADDAAGPGGW